MKLYNGPAMPVMAEQIKPKKPKAIKYNPMPMESRPSNQTRQVASGLFGKGTK